MELGNNIIFNRTFFNRWPYLFVFEMLLIHSNWNFIERIFFQHIFLSVLPSVMITFIWLFSFFKLFAFKYVPTYVSLCIITTMQNSTIWHSVPSFRSPFNGMMGKLPSYLPGFVKLFLINDDEPDIANVKKWLKRNAL